MKEVKRISYNKEGNSHLTSTDKKILVQMLNKDMDYYMRRGKKFTIEKSDNNTALVKITTFVQNPFRPDKKERCVSKTLVSYS